MRLEEERFSFETINLELIFADLEVLEKREQKLEKLIRSGDGDAKKHKEIKISAKISSKHNIENTIGFNSKDIFVFDENGKRIKS